MDLWRHRWARSRGRPTPLSRTQSGRTRGPLAPMRGIRTLSSTGSHCGDLLPGRNHDRHELLSLLDSQEQLNGEPATRTSLFVVTGLNELDQTAEIRPPLRVAAEVGHKGVGPRELGRSRMQPRTAGPSSFPAVPTIPPLTHRRQSQVIHRSSQPQRRGRVVAYPTRLPPCWPVGIVRATRTPGRWRRR